MWRSSRSANTRGWFLTAVMLMCVPPLASQDSWITGKVRVHAPSIAKPRIVGTVDRATPDTLVVHGLTPAAADTVWAIPLAAISSLQVSTGTHSNVGKGFGYGLLGGGLAGAVIGALSCSHDDLLGSAGCAKVLGVLGAGAGAVVGLIVGAVSRSDTWEEVGLPSERLSFEWRGVEGRAQLGLRFVF